MFDMPPDAPGRAAALDACLALMSDWRETMRHCHVRNRLVREQLRVLNLETGRREEPPEGHWLRMVHRVRQRNWKRMSTELHLELREAWSLYAKNEVSGRAHVVRVHERVREHVRVHVHARVRVRVHFCLCMCVFERCLLMCEVSPLHCATGRMCMCMCVCVCVCVCVYAYVYVYVCGHSSVCYLGCPGCAWYILANRGSSS